MSKKKPYIATSPIKRDGKFYEVGATLNLTEEQAEGLHVEPARQEDVKASEPSRSGEKKPAVSTAMNADPAIAMIESTPYAELDGFVTEDEGRKTVLKAWEAKQAEAEGDDKESES